MKKTTIRTIVLGSAALSAATAGAWFLFTSESAQKQPSVPTAFPPFSVGKKLPVQKTAVQPKTEPSSSQLPDESPVTQNNAQDTEADSAESFPENAVDDSPAQEQEQGFTAQNAVGDAALSSEQAVPPSDEGEASAQVPSESAPSPPASLSGEIETDSDSTETSLSSPGEISEQLQDTAASARQQGEQTTAEVACEEAAPILTRFFSKVEEKEYSRNASEEQPLQEHFNDLASQLVNNPPVVTRETEDLYTVLTNTAHFFRILGKDNMVLLQKILKQESADFEKVAAEIYRISTAGASCVSGKEKLEIPFAAAYEYAGFFLNTLGGRSYLFRRDPGTRLLVNYYAILILDQADKRHANRYGLDIRKQIPQLIREMEASNRLTWKDRYLEKLYDLAEEYQALP